MARQRSHQQNAYYWAVIIPCCADEINKQSGSTFSTEEIHRFFNKEFCFKEVELSNGYFLKVPLKTNGLTVMDFMEYIDKIQSFCKEVLGINIPQVNNFNQ